MAARSEGGKPFLVNDDGRRRLKSGLEKRLLPGEIVYFAESSNYKTKRCPDGQWVAYSHIADPKTGIKKKSTPRGFKDDAVAAVEYLEGLREVRKADVIALDKPKTMGDLFDYCVDVVWQKKGATTLRARKQRWRDYAAAAWGPVELNNLKGSDAKTWFYERAEIGDVPYSQLIELKSEMYAMGEHLGDLDPKLDSKKNPFANISLEEPPPRDKVTIPPGAFPALEAVCLAMASPEGGESELVTLYIVEMWLTSLYTGLRFAEVIALGRDQVDTERRILTVDRAMRAYYREISPGTVTEGDKVVPWAMHLPKGGRPHPRPELRRVRRVPLSDHAMRVLLPVTQRPEDTGPYRLLWPSGTERPRAKRLVEKAFATLRTRLQEVSTLAPLSFSGTWPAVETRRGRPRNFVVEAARQDPRLRLPALFEHIDFRDSRNSFVTYAKSVGIDQVDRDHIMGHRQEGVGNRSYVEITDEALAACRERLSGGWKPLSLTSDEPS